jgi:aryl-alcohol dehydrogenase-like predicted oxidoreductase
VIVRVPFDEGSLTGRIKPDTTFEEGDFRNYYFRGDRKSEVHERVQAIVSELGASEDEIAEIALRYILSHPAVSTVIPGMRSVGNVERNMAVGDSEGLPEDWIRKLKSHRWDRNFYA